MDVYASQDEIFERMKNFFQRLGNPYECVTNTRNDGYDLIAKIMVEVLSVLAIATKEIKQSLANE